MPTTQDYEFLLECANVIGVDYDERANRVRVYVSQKVPKDELRPEDDVERRVQEVDGVDVDVVDSGYGEEREGFDALSILQPIPDAAEGRESRHRPIPAGVSEINANSTAATAGPYPARLEDPSAAVWDDGLEGGELVRLSNNHVYARSNEADLGEPIVQPSPQDGGELPDDEVGELVGYVPIEDGVRVDVAARSVDSDRESTSAYELDPAWPTGIRRDGYEDLRDETVTKSGRTTAVSSATVEATSASVEVNFGGEHGTVLLRDQLVAGYMSEGGDSGSPVFHDETGELVGLLFAGSAEQTILNRIGNVEADLGVELLTAEPDNGAGEGEGDEDDGDENDGGTPVPVFTTTIDTTLEIDVDGLESDAGLSLSSITIDGRPTAGRTVPVTITLTSASPGDYWLEVDGDRTTFEVDESHGDDTGDDGYQRAVTAELTIPSDADETLEIRIRGGTVQRS
ncbi:S1 family peptidase [Halobacteria archaeon AArc-m2/3/4]|uniref:S1 family peptidase n=1 Tax=Natronoglomus mannanivorans TaxID=2979990 RepID=A0ABT2QHU1_9EURY|nr:S1 family peptidase [Halobacteria archaeon AArc-m2/3/4]